MLEFNIQNIISGLLFGIVFGGGLFTIADELIASMRMESPDDESLNSEWFHLLMKYLMPIAIFTLSGILIGPLFGGILKYVNQQGLIFGLDPTLVYIGMIFTISMLLNVAVFLTKTPFPTWKLISNTWMFLSLGLLLSILN